MKAWSHSPVSIFKTVFFFDTNILCYLIDGRYPQLVGLVNYLKNSTLIDLISSEYVMLEFIGVRKKEHYFRTYLHHAKLSKKNINLSDFIKNHNRFALDDIDFHSLLPEIKSNVESEIEKISSDFNIKYNIGFHSGLYKPTSEICLTTKISKEDSLVLLSSVLLDDGKTNAKVILLTNDSDFKNWFYEDEVKINIDKVFSQSGIIKPDIQNVKNILNRFNLTEKNTDLNDIIDAIMSYIKNKLIVELKNLFVGTSFKPRDKGVPADCVCLEIKSENIIPNNKYITIIGSDLNFVYNPDEKISFWNNGKEIPKEGFKRTENNSYLSFKLHFDNLDKNKKKILTKLRENGNLIFIHPVN
jgi:hypothetical protein